MKKYKEKKKVLLLGGAGFIGYYLAKYINEISNYEIAIADNLSRGTMDEGLSCLLENNDITFIEADFTEKDSFSLLDDDYDQLYMLASMVGVENTLTHPHEVIRINTSLILNTLEWVKNSEIKKIIYTSTSENYAGTIDVFDYKIPTPEDVPLTIQDIAHPRSSYAATKILGESAFLNYSKIFGFECTILRYHNIYGPRMGFKHVIPNLVERFIKDKENPFKMYGHDQTRAFCFISDAVEVTSMAMENNHCNGKIYHIGTQDEITIETLIRATGDFFNYDGEYEVASTHSGSTSRRCPDISKASFELEYKPKVYWKQGLDVTLEWYKEYFESGGKSYGYQ